MSNQLYPTVTHDFLHSCMCDSNLIADHKKFGSTHIYVLKGNSYIGKRTIFVRPDENGDINFLQATGLAARMSFMGKILTWLHENKSWKEGAFVATQDHESS